MLTALILIIAISTDSTNAGVVAPDTATYQSQPVKTEEIDYLGRVESVIESTHGYSRYKEYRHLREKTAADGKVFPTYYVSSLWAKFGHA